MVFGAVMFSSTLVFGANNNQKDEKVTCEQEVYMKNKMEDATRSLSLRYETNEEHLCEVAYSKPTENAQKPRK